MTHSVEVVLHTAIYDGNRWRETPINANSFAADDTAGNVIDICQTYPVCDKR